MKMPSEEDYKISICNPKLIKCPVLEGGKVYKDVNRDTPYMWAGGFCVVFKYAKADGQDCAVRCWKADVDNSMQRAQKISEALNKVNLPYFVNFEYQDNAIVAASDKHPVIIMDWVNANSFKQYLEDNLHNPSALDKLAQNFKKMAADLHANKLSHGDLQHGNIMVKDDGSIVLVDYDSIYTPGMESFSDTIKGQIGYQHPARVNVKNMTPKADYFSELIIYSGILMIKAHPELWNELQLSDTETFILSQEDINSPDSSDMLDMMCRDSDGEISMLGNAIREALKKNSINDLLPLENISGGAVSPSSSSSSTSAASVSSILDKINAFTPKPSASKEPYSKDTVNSILSKIKSM